MRDRAPTAADIAGLSTGIETDLEALFREVRRDALARVSGAATPEDALASIEAMLVEPLE